MSRPALLRAAVGLTLAAASVNAVRGADRHAAVLGAIELVLALLYAWPRATRWAGGTLLAVMALALVFHALRLELAGVPLLASLAVLALWPERSVQAVEESDREALAVLRLQRPGSFSHPSHLRVARCYLIQLPLGVALEQFSADLKRYAAAKGATGKFHQTLTVGFLLALRAALADAPANETFEQLLARHPRLAASDCVASFYSAELLASPRARSDFVFPDRLSPSQRTERPAA